MIAAFLFVCGMVVSLLMGISIGAGIASDEE